MLRFHSEKKDRHWLGMCVKASEQSKDPSTRVGSFILGPDYEVRSSGYNGFPRGIKDDHRLQDRETKLNLVVHAELNALLAAARVGTPLKGCTLFLAATDQSGEVWGGPPCTRCSVHIIQSGIDEIVSYTPKSVPSRWHADLQVARGILDEAGVLYREYRPVEDRPMIGNPKRNLGDRLLEAEGKEPINPRWIEAPAEPTPRLADGIRVFNYVGVLVEHASYVDAHFPDIPDCKAFGDDHDSAMAASCEAVGTYIKKATILGRDLPEQRALDDLRANDPHFADRINKGGAVFVVSVHILNGEVGAFIAGRPDLGANHP